MTQFLLIMVCIWGDRFLESIINLTKVYEAAKKDGDNSGRVETFNGILDYIYYLIIILVRLVLQESRILSNNNIKTCS